MKKLGYFLCTCALATTLCSCIPDRVQFNDSNNFGKGSAPIFTTYNGYGYSPGFTGGTQGFDGYGDYDDGFGPSFWNPRFYFYQGGLQGYGKYPYPQ